MFVLTRHPVNVLSLSLLTAYERCSSEAEKQKLLATVRYGKLKRFVKFDVYFFPVQE